MKGEVKKPGVYVLTGPTTLSEAVTLAGGPATPNALAGQRVSGGGTSEFEQIGRAAGRGRG